MLASEKPATLPPRITTLKGDFSFVVVHFERGMMAKSRFMVIVGAPVLTGWVGISMATSPISACTMVC